MNKKLIIAVVIILLLVLGGAGLLIMNQNKSGGTTNPTSSSQSSEQKSLKDLMGLGGSQECSFTDVQTGSSGTFYMGGGNFRGDFSSKVNGTLTLSHMISDGTNLYMWMDGLTQGFKFSQSSVENPGAEVQNGFDVNSKVGYSCKPWIIDSSQFSLPKAVTFASAPSPVTLPSGAESAPNSQCAACDSLSGDSKTQCLVALKCS